MIVVSGTKRSGTSMWMQVLAAAGLPVLGQQFPRNWEQSLKQVNPDGFYESILRQGVYYRTNPHPVTGKYFLPEQVAGYAVKIFVPGVVRTERAYIERLVANIREWREYEASILRLYAIEREHDLARNPNAPEPVVFPPAFEWWMENFALVRDISIRRYPARLQTYDQVLADPAKVIAATMEWIGVGDVEAAVAAVKPEHRNFVRPESDSIEPRFAKVFDDLYAAIADGGTLSGTLLDTLNRTNREMLPKLVELQTAVAKYHMSQPGPKPEQVFGLPDT
ncbi:MAG: hypothetical protein KBB21_10910 [Nannocystaceae bacterium]|nr:hypothetical protein [Deltaproteobacteria bacterium]MBK8715101.1 hypothetical protein [Deltaproteobacteria bacterium]MBP7287119.1 hypothetical protein [Nannocystaceae bacterium]